MNHEYIIDVKVESIMDGMIDELYKPYHIECNWCDEYVLKESAVESKYFPSKWFCCKDCMDKFIECNEKE